MAKANGRKNADNKVILALACGATIESAARQSGVSETTIYRRLNEPSFQLRLREVQADILNRTAAALTAAATESVRTLMELQKPGTPPATRLGAARAVIELGLKIREIVALETRIATLERQFEPTRPGGADR